MISSKIKNSTTFRSLLIVVIFIIMITGIAAKGYAKSQNMQSYGRIIGIAGYQRTKTYVLLLDAYNVRQDYLNGDYEKYEESIKEFYSLDGIHSEYLNYFYEIRDGNEQLNIPEETDEEIIAEIDKIIDEVKTYLDTLEQLINEPNGEYDFSNIYAQADNIVNEINRLVNLYEDRYQYSIDYENNLFLYSFGITIIFAIVLFWINTHIFRYETLAKYDVLTGLRNIGYLKQESSSIESKPYAVIFMDLNKFKSINDTYGHAIGDDILRTVGKRITKVFKHDYAFRYGGDEIVIFIPEKNCGKIDEYINDINDVIFQPVRDSKGMIHNVKGAVGIIGKDVTKPSVPKALNMADSLMYRAKQDNADKAYYVNDNNELFEIIGNDID